MTLEWSDLSDSELRQRLEYRGVAPEFAGFLADGRESADVAAVITELLEGDHRFGSSEPRLG